MKRENKNISNTFLQEYKKKEDNTKIVMKEIEKKTDTKITELFTGSITKEQESTDLEKTLTNIMSDGVKEFKEKTGRNLTYGEMREMYG